MDTLTCFKAYDIRGRLGEELNEEIAYRIGRGFAQVLGAKRVVIGRDIRPTSESLQKAVEKALIEEGVEVLDLGLCGTEEMYFATTHFEADGGIEVTASHNPMDYNGMKMVRKGSAPLGNDSGLLDIKALAEKDAFEAGPGGGSVTVAEGAREAYVKQILSFIDISKCKPLKIVANAGNGAAGPTFDAIADALAEAGAPFEFIRIHHEPDGSFPNGIPNPLLEENQPPTSQAVVEHGADLAIAWDGDFDRCFFFDHEGKFIGGEYVVAMLAEAFLQKVPGAGIVHDPRVVWNTQDVVGAAGGRAIQCRTGHAFFKQMMRDEDAIYGGEMSAHHYFKDFVYCDSGMVPWVLVVELMGLRDIPLADLVGERIAAFPSSGENNFRLEDPKAAIARVIDTYADSALSRDDTDGVSFAFENWRFNLRSSNTEPVVRLNIEARDDIALIAEKLNEISTILKA